MKGHPTNKINREFSKKKKSQREESKALRKDSFQLSSRVKLGPSIGLKKCKKRFRQKIIQSMKNTGLTTCISGNGIDRRKRNLPRSSRLQKEIMNTSENVKSVKKYLCL